ncbi:MAG: Proline/betaine transporter [Luteibacter sp.]|uniref:MFS transporter n=1 Tax=Luteibacter sp. TaxID=1886636 RepID=UPI001381B26C|nr:MFS transporter [Luteibacter sp.]KAF1006174.1 MAG: Proline/betaine transporter [Luteibacter sp.]
MTTVADHSRWSRKALVAISFANGLEFFDFTIYSFFAPIIAKLYFPASDSMTSMLLAIGTFGVGFFMRPVGAVVMGAYADRYGRRAGMSLTMWLMMAGSALIAFSPTHASIGVAAPLLIIASRLVQGFALGGEIGASTAWLVEQGAPATRGYRGSWQFMSQALNTLVAAVVGVVLTTSLDSASLASWGWRLPFVFGLAIGPLGIYLRRQLSEEWSSRDPSAMVFGRTLRRYGLVVVQGTVLMIGASAVTYIVLFYLSSYAEKYLHLPAGDALWLSVAASASAAVFSPIAGHLSDRLGRTYVIGVSRIVLVAAIYPSWVLMRAAAYLPLSLAIAAFLAMLVAFTTAPCIVLLAELFPVRIRASGMSIVYCLAVSVFGGFAQFFALGLIRWTGSILAPAWYLVACGLLSLLPLPFLDDPTGRPLVDDRVRSTPRS